MADNSNKKKVKMDPVAAAAAAAAAATTSGQGRAVFTWDEALTSAMPEDVRKFEKDMHGGFSEDPETGVVYTGIPGYGLLSISPDLKTWKKLGSDPQLEGNIHGIVVFKHNGTTMIAVAQNKDQKILIIQLDGTVAQVIDRPIGDEFTFKEANEYYKGEHEDPSRIFCCTDVTYLDSTLYVVTGYCPGDFVLTLQQDAEGEWKWGPKAWGGKGDGEGQFRTAHGVFAHKDCIYVANREAHQVVMFSKDGKFIRTLPNLPPGSRFCNVSYAEHDDFLLLNPLEALNDTQSTSPIFAYADETVISTIIPGDLGIPVLRHCHHVWPHYVKGDGDNKHLYVLVHGWNVGKFAVLKHVTS